MATDLPGKITLLWFPKERDVNRVMNLRQIGAVGIYSDFPNIALVFAECSRRRVEKLLGHSEFEMIIANGKNDPVLPFVPSDCPW